MFAEIPVEGEYEIWVVNWDNSRAIDYSLAWWGEEAPAKPQGGKVKGMTCNDTNQDHLFTPGESGRASVSVTLHDATTDEALFGTLTDANGEYTFDDVAPGTYYARVDRPLSHNIADDNVGTDDTVDSDFDPITFQSQNVVITSSFEAHDLDAGIATFVDTGDAKLQGTVWDDLDDDGIQQSGSSGVSGITVKLYDEDYEFITETVTDSLGNYQFTGLDEGVYTIEVVTSDNWRYTDPDQGLDDNSDSDADLAGVIKQEVLLQGETRDDLDVGLYYLGTKSISGFVWEDEDSLIIPGVGVDLTEALGTNGIQDPDELGVATVEVNLYDSQGNLVDSTYTNAHGEYEFWNVPDGTYYLEIVEPVGYDFVSSNQGIDDTVDSDVGTNGQTANFTLNSSNDSVDFDAGLIWNGTGRIGDYVWLDANGNGIQDTGESGASNVSVELRDDDGTVVATTTTDTNGAYEFDNVTPGDYSVKVTEPATYDFSPQYWGTESFRDSDVNANGESEVFTLVAGEDRPDLDAGLVLESHGGLNSSIAGRAWDDLDEDGIQDVGESSLSDVIVTVYDSHGNYLDSTVTDANGDYLFDGLPAGDYYVEMYAPTDKALTTQGAGTDPTLDSDFDPTTSITSVFTLAINQDKVNVDGGLIEAISGVISGRVWDDVNGDGVQDTGEPSITTGVVVDLYDASGELVDWTVSDEDGEHEFDYVTPGDYQVQFEMIPDSIGFSPMNQGSDDTRDSDVNGVGESAVFTLGSQETIDDLDAGFVFDYGGTITGRVWHDVNGNGIQDTGETGVGSGLSVSLYDSYGFLVATVLTDSNGVYTFEDVVAGEYYLDFGAPPPGSEYTSQDQGSDDTQDSDVNYSGLTALFTLTANETKDDLDAGLFVSL